MTPTEHHTKSEAEAAVAQAVTQGRCTGGHAKMEHNGKGGRTVWYACVHRNHATTWRL